MSAFWLKIIAIAAMTLNHIAHVFGDYMPDGVYYVCMGVGGLTFPIMAYLVVEGYKHTKNYKKYARRLLAFAFVALIPFGMAFEPSLNVLFTLLFGLLAIYLYENMESRPAFWIVFVFLILASVVCDWQIIGVPMIFCSHVIKDKRGRVIVPVLIVWFFIGLLLWGMTFSGELDQRELIANALYAFGGCTLTIPLLLSYNGQRGPALKYFFYAFYPAHLAVLVVLKYVI